MGLDGREEPLRVVPIEARAPVLPLRDGPPLGGACRPFRRFPVCCPVTYHAGPFLKLPLAYISGFGSQVTKT
jgi:hypothetical protein